MGRRPLNLTPEEVEERRQRRALQTKNWALNHPEQYRECTRASSLAYYYANKERLNLVRAALTRQKNARKREEAALALIL